METVSDMIRRKKAQEIEARFPTCCKCKLRRMRQSYIHDNGCKLITCAPCRNREPKIGCTVTRLALKKYVNREVSRHYRVQETARLYRRDALALERHMNPPFAELVGKPRFLANGYVSYTVRCEHTVIRNMIVTSIYADKKAAMAAIERCLKRITNRLQRKMDSVIVCKWSISNFDIPSSTGSRIEADEWARQTITAR